MTVFEFFKYRKYRKQLKSMRNDFRMYEDVLEPSVAEELSTRLDEAGAMFSNWGAAEDIPIVFKVLDEQISAALPPSRHHWFKENFDVIVSALAVAFCFRAYFYQPFKIPTGSMMPTLYGIHGEAAPTPTAFDKQPLKFFKWCVTGESWRDVRVTRGGTITGYQQSPSMPGFAAVVVNRTDAYALPDDVARELANTTLRPGTVVRAGQRLWSGYVRSGDFLFVNRWIWNFRHPTLGETVVFSTQGVGVDQNLAQNQHYIKRLCGLPGQLVDIKPDASTLFINGKPALEPKRLDDIANKREPYEGATMRYPGFTTPDGKTPVHFMLEPNEYVCFGDNSTNSFDSRYWGKVPAKNLLGPASFVHWPFTSPRWGLIH